MEHRKFNWSCRSSSGLLKEKVAPLCAHPPRYLFTFGMKLFYHPRVHANSLKRARWLFALELVTTVAVHDNRGKEVRWRSLNSNANCGAKPAKRQQVKQIASFPFATTVTELLIGSKWRKKSLKRFRSEHPDRSSFSFN
jgi:hypothetical protein